MTYKLSPSTLNLLRECPRCFYLHVKLKVKRPRGPFASIVSKMDSITKKYFDEYRSKGILPPIIKGKVKGKLAVGMPKTLKYEDKRTGIILRGLPDEYLQLKDNSIIPLDHKTKSKPPEKPHPAYKVQLNAYSYLLLKNDYKTKNEAYLVYYYPEVGELHLGMPLKVKVLKVKTQPMTIPRMLTKAKKILNGRLPKKTKTCEFCQWNP
ncbi:MAG: PD-(D/E)XK nuclease family protein [Candidatus Diapherotrites archaeon]|nr:PD-(D/E)XK nuclease family protein [Candidatus Diapherotrites archaeon]